MKIKEAKHILEVSNNGCTLLLDASGLNKNKLQSISLEKAIRRIVSANFIIRKFNQKAYKVNVENVNAKIQKIISQFPFPNQLKFDLLGIEEDILKAASTYPVDIKNAQMALQNSFQKYPPELFDLISKDAISNLLTETYLPSPDTIELVRLFRKQIRKDGKVKTA